MDQNATILNRVHFLQCFLYRITGKAPKDKAILQREILDSILKDGAFHTYILMSDTQLPFTGHANCATSD